MRTVVLTGGTGDLGHIVVPRLASDYQVVVVYRTRDSYDRLVSATGASNVRGVASIDEVESAYALVHLAGGFAMGSSAQTFSDMFEKNVLVAVRAVEALAQKLEHGGRVVAISSNAALTMPAGLAAYTAAKSALDAFVQTLAKDLAERRITANALLPSAMDSPANQASAQKLVPRANVAEAIAFLLTEAAANITGQLIELKA